MGHGYVLNFSRDLIKRLYAKGVIRIIDCINLYIQKQEAINKKIQRCEEQIEKIESKKEYKECPTCGNAHKESTERERKIRAKITKWENDKRKYGFSASEGMYYETNMLSMGFDIVADFHHSNNIIEPILETNEEKEMWEKWRNNKLDSAKDFEGFDSLIRWQFSNGGRKKYLDNTIKHLTNFYD
jgi:hypothetical protein